MAPPYRWVKAPSDYPGPVYSWAGRVLEHHLVWWINTGERVPDGFDVHHRDDVGLNNDFGNLELMAHGEHSAYHNVGVGRGAVERTCACGVLFGRPRWYMDARLAAGQKQFSCSNVCATAARPERRDGETHGTSSGYNRHKCRCSQCRAYAAAKYRRRKSKTALVVETGGVVQR